MDFLKVTRYHPRHPILRPLIKFYWVLKSEQPTTLHHKLLPVNNVDLVFNFSSPARYSSGGKVEHVPRYSFYGLRNEYVVVRQVGELDMLGVSFFPGGLRAVLKSPLSEFRNRAVDLDAVIPNSGSALDERLACSGAIHQRIEALEVYLSELVDPGLIPSTDTYGLIKDFCASTDGTNVTDFCDRQGISARRLERMFGEWIGTSPKGFKRLNRFQKALNRLLKKGYTDLTSLAHEYDYFDQAHFIRDFKSFTGSSPLRFVKENKSLKQLLKITFHGGSVPETEPWGSLLDP